MGKKPTVDDKDKLIELQKKEISYLTNMVMTLIEYMDKTESAINGTRQETKMTFANSPMNREFAKSIKKD